MKNIDDPHTNPTFEYSVQRNVLHEKPNSRNETYCKVYRESVFVYRYRACASGLYVGED